MTKTELRIKELLVELQAHCDQMSVKVAKVEGLERELGDACKTRTLAQAEANRQLERARKAEADRDRLREALAEIVNVLGENTCTACNCQGCLWEMGEASRLARAALSAVDANQDIHSRVPPNALRATRTPGKGERREYPDL